ncbi:MAG TPA: glycosyltransferase [Patescibacteria group bacterium]|nr:glycosyltransferase [Patescibacteria group bacterium]
MNKTQHISSFISLIVPAFCQEKTIQKDVRQIQKVMDTITKNYEVIIVVDGYIDKTVEQVKKIKSRKIKVVGYAHNHGKGYAVRYGMAKARGNLIAFIDAGMDLHPRGLQQMIQRIQDEKLDIVIGSKLHPDSNVHYPWQRRVLSWGYRTMVKMLFSLSIRDTQVGLKLFRRKVLEDVLPRLLVKKFAFDIEILAVANYLGYTKIEESPVDLRFNNWSSITSKNFWKAIYDISWDTVAVYYRLKIMHYYDDKSKRKWRYDEELNFRINVTN